MVWTPPSPESPKISWNRNFHTFTTGEICNSTVDLKKKTIKSYVPTVNYIDWQYTIVPTVFNGFRGRLYISTPKSKPTQKGETLHQGAM
jgi:hypothetical protein